MTSNDSASSNSGSTDSRQQKPLFWRSLSELRGEKEFDQFLHREFPVAASEFPEGVSRRRWMQLISASLAVVGATGCRYPEETIAPFAIRPEGRVPGESYERATNFELAGRVYNLIIECVDGRPLKIQPNKLHPIETGTDVYSQASILGLYDPDRARFDEGPVIRKTPERRLAAAWNEFDQESSKLIAEAEADKGSKFAVLMSPTASPSLQRMLGKLKERLPEATVCQYDGVTGGAMQQATQKILGEPAKQVLNLDRAKVIATFEADILGNGCGGSGNAAGFAKHRDPADGEMNRLYVVEGGYTTTGASSDTRLALRPSQMPAFVAELRRRIEAIQGGESPATADGEESAFDEIEPAERLERFLNVLAADLVEAGEEGVVVVGDGLDPKAIAAGVQINQMLGSYGKAQVFRTVETGDITLAELAERLNKGETETVVILGDNPVAIAPGDIDLTAALGKAKTSIYLGEYDDETALLCDWSLPLAHPLESWGDCVNDQGWYGVCQPQILPLLGGRSTIEFLAVMLGLPQTDGEQIVRLTADQLGKGALSNREWRKLLHDGFLEKLVVDSPELTLQSGNETEITGTPTAVSEVDRDNVEVLFMPADGIYDGRFANNGWLQEMPQSLTKLTWDNAAVMSPATAKALGIKHGLFVTLRTDDAEIQLPVYEMPGLAPGVVSTQIGYGRERAGMVGGYTEEDVPVVGINVSPIRRSDAMLVRYEMEARPRFEEYEFATTQDHWAIDDLGRDETEMRSFSLVREGTLKLLKDIPEFVESKGPHTPEVGRTGSPWREPMNEIEEETEYLPQWGMAIDMNKCTGCNACVIACQSENNVPIVGREQVLNSREMHWLRIDRYFQGDEDNADVVQQPMMCQHCETAPCEQVCPVAATVHTHEGINAMVYNRCIGTRYCANNCPFKVRRFNYFNYNEEVGVGYGIDAYPSNIENANRKMQSLVLNPEVTVRGRGVMEKCTYCIQRIEKAKITARKEDRPLADGDVVTACQSACPSNAIEFGNVADPESKVSKLHKNVRSYGALGQLNVKPRTEYLARIRNTPARLMTSKQLRDLAELEAPHHDDHEEESEHETRGIPHSGDDHKSEAPAADEAH